ncbi:LCP family protein [Phaeacidiphilus oryzae]|uniref:LCP family protein n=1 Tax=Phaeacidiphilus oryzae TaxID=348818 RepID=UPI00055B34DF|nr:LCP family protein [Phaeacidiphilus oryzae]
MAVVVLAAAGGLYYAYRHYTGNIHSSGLFGGISGNAGTEKPDAFGRTPINILAMGSDARSNAADCKLGGDCSAGGGERADVEMIVHISADRSNMTVMSIPRDLMTELPGCTAYNGAPATTAHRGQINAALDNGPGCSVAAVHQLTGITIDHFVKVDFSGVVSMSDAVGGVQVCVDNNVYDPYSHLKLSKGTHTLKGVGALEFLRTRHGFGDGGDIGRTEAQHIFLTEMIKKLKSAGTLTDPAAVLSLADAATKALTVDSGLDSITKLVGLASDLNKVPTKRITFTTMQTVDDTQAGESGRLLIAPGARNLFQTIVDDQSLTTATGAKSSAASATASASASGSGSSAGGSSAGGTVSPSSIPVSVLNGSGIPARAATVAGALVGKGFSQTVTGGNAGSGAAYSHSYVYYGAGQSDAARTVASALGIPSGQLRTGTSPGVQVIIGTDWSSGTAYPGGGTGSSSGSSAAGSSSSGPSGGSTGALTNAHVQKGDTTTCAHVSPYATVALHGVGMTPTQAYADSPQVKNSDG